MEHLNILDVPETELERLDAAQGLCDSGTVQRIARYGLSTIHSTLFSSVPTSSADPLV